MQEIRRGHDRGHANHGWLDSWHSFSFAGYHDPAHMGFGPLRVINEDRVQGGQGFGTHAHQDMEIISYVLDGALEHKDSLGTGSVIRRGDVQRMSAGRGVRHSEFNHSASAPVHFLQIWIVPRISGVAASYEEKHFDDDAKRGRLCLVASPDRRDGSLRIHQDALLYSGLPDDGQSLSHVLAPGRLGYVHVVRGSIVANGQALTAGDALKLSGEPSISLDQANAAEVLLFDLPR